ncbi:RNHCP domain-containing protein [Tistlia consotensis]|uniref:RNHCP domain-containing protein n=1 Tax=Tistlia consotensis USBA 355 TaxID=560819 RepID=A0A1Y6CA02_9PROT|nr:RNHCP domain-containing protein [Tistlia consotensis]SMF53758.1 RNHCP domain-containing protein [Tistlia consotensis USBA 355]SNR85990.1 RNHCP domain-containing protein [Tistlia consotensis]
MAKRFQRRVEDFVCEHCGRAVTGDGFTNHCPACLWSKHVDLDPGDRAAGCGGAMRPVAVESRARGYLITHRCERCGLEKRNRASPADDFAAILAVARGRADPRS